MLTHIGSPSFCLEVMLTVSAHLLLVRANKTYVLSTKLDVDRTEENKKSDRYLWSVLQLTTFSIIFSFPFLFSCSVVFDSLWPHALQNARLPCPSPSLRACLNSCPSSWWCHPTISSSVVPFSSCFLSFPALGSFSMSQLFASGASVSACPSNEYSGLISFRIDWIDFLAVPGTLKSLLQHHSSKLSILWHSAFFIDQLYIHTRLLDKP